jgi:hypothetical protein
MINNVLKGIYISLFEFIIKGIDLIIETSGTNFTCFIEKVNCEKTALTTLIMPFFNVGFIRDANTNRPSTINSTFSVKYLF